jgi:hypothetical protein
MKPGDLVVTVDSPENELDPSAIGLFGVVIRETELEDGHPINSWCDWWVLIGGELTAWSKEHLKVVNETND